eukprot:3697803-Amphidinium_carterae.2
MAVDTQGALHVGLAKHRRSSSRPSKLWRSRELRHGRMKWARAATGCCRYCRVIAFWRLGCVLTFVHKSTSRGRVLMLFREQSLVEGVVLPGAAAVIATFAGMAQMSACLARTAWFAEA